MFDVFCFIESGYRKVWTSSEYVVLDGSCHKKYFLFPKKKIRLLSLKKVCLLQLYFFISVFAFNTEFWGLKAKRQKKGFQQGIYII